MEGQFERVAVKICRGAVQQTPEAYYGTGKNAFRGGIDLERSQRGGQAKLQTKKESKRPKNCMRTKSMLPKLFLMQYRKIFNSHNFVTWHKESNGEPVE